jgi:hypothetical protein
LKHYRPKAIFRLRKRTKRDHKRRKQEASCDHPDVGGKWPDPRPCLFSASQYKGIIDHQKMQESQIYFQNYPY